MLETLGAILKWLILLPILAIVAMIGVANDQLVTMRLNPFEPEDAALSIQMALYMFAFLAFVLGALAGALAMWNGQRKWRRRAREKREEAALWQGRARIAEHDQPRSDLLVLPARRAGG